MNKYIFLVVFFILQLSTLIAQKREEGFDAVFRRTDQVPRMFVVTEKEGDRWHRTAYYSPEKSMALDAWYLDEACKIEDGEFRLYHSNRLLKRKRNYKEGKKHGPCLDYNETGILVDSAIFDLGHQKGIRIKWSNDGIMTDSFHYDGAGNGTEVTWDENGNLYSTGYVVADTAKDKRWQYFYPNGKLLAVEDYQDGKRKSVICYDEAGNKLDSCRESVAQFPGGDFNMRRFVERNLNPNVPIKNKAADGTYTVYVDFVVDTSGKLINIKPLTNFGFGMEQEVIRMLNKQPVWNPAIRFGQRIKAYRRQPITFQISK